MQLQLYELKIIKINENTIFKCFIDKILFNKLILIIFVDQWVRNSSSGASSSGGTNGSTLPRAEFGSADDLFMSM